jgi:hypothetical protein
MRGNGKMRDLDKNPYSPDEERVAKWIMDKTDIGGGDDPIGFLMASHEYAIHQRNELQKQNAKFRKVANELDGLGAIIEDSVRRSCKERLPEIIQILRGNHEMCWTPQPKLQKSNT